MPDERKKALAVFREQKDGSWKHIGSIAGHPEEERSWCPAGTELLMDVAAEPASQVRIGDLLQAPGGRIAWRVLGGRRTREVAAGRFTLLPLQTVAQPPQLGA
jgi:hypothetical protein